MKKRFHVVSLILAAILCLSGFTGFAASEDLVIDATKLSGGNANGYPVETAYGLYTSLGSLDMSQYEKVVFSYASDAGAVFSGDLGNLSFALTTNGAIQDATTGAALSTATVLARVDNIGAVKTSWQAEELTATIDSDYKGEVFFAAFHPTRGNCALLKSITFVRKTENADTGDLSVALPMCVALLTAMTVVIKTKNSKISV